MACRASPSRRGPLRAIEVLSAADREDVERDVGLRRGRRQRTGGVLEQHPSRRDGGCGRSESRSLQVLPHQRDGSTVLLLGEVGEALVERVPVAPVVVGEGNGTSGSVRADRRTGLIPLRPTVLLLPVSRSGRRDSQREEEEGKGDGCHLLQALPQNRRHLAHGALVLPAYRSRKLLAHLYVAAQLLLDVLQDLEDLGVRRPWRRHRVPRAGAGASTALATRSAKRSAARRFRSRAMRSAVSRTSFASLRSSPAMSRCGINRLMAKS